MYFVRITEESNKVIHTSENQNITDIRPIHAEMSHMTKDRFYDHPKMSTTEDQRNLLIQKPPVSLYDCPSK